MASAAPVRRPVIAGQARNPANTSSPTDITNPTQNASGPLAIEIGIPAGIIQGGITPVVCAMNVAIASHPSATSPKRTLEPGESSKAASWSERVSLHTAPHSGHVSVGVRSSG